MFSQLSGSIVGAALAKVLSLVYTKVAQLSTSMVHSILLLRVSWVQWVGWAMAFLTFSSDIKILQVLGQKYSEVELESCSTIKKIFTIWNTNGLTVARLILHFQFWPIAFIKNKPHLSLNYFFTPGISFCQIKWCGISWNKTLKSLSEGLTRTFVPKSYSVLHEKLTLLLTNFTVLLFFVKVTQNITY